MDEDGGRPPVPVTRSTLAELMAGAMRVVGADGALRLMLIRLSQARPEDAAARRRFEGLLPPRGGVAK
jgi:hypothetical protein